MKKYFPLFDEATEGPLTGKAIRLVEDTSGVHVDLVEVGNSGTYKAAAILPGVYSVFDVTDGTPGIDLDQKVDVLSSTLVQEQITFPGDAQKFLSGNGNFANVNQSNVVGLTASFAAKQNTIPAGGDSEVYFGNKAFRAIEMEDLPADISTFSPRQSVATFSAVILNIASGGTDAPASVQIALCEISKENVFSFKAIVLSASTGLPMGIESLEAITIEIASGASTDPVFVAFKNKLQALGPSFIGHATILNVNPIDSTASSSAPPCYAKIESPSGNLTLYGSEWAAGDFPTSYKASGILNG